MTLQILWFILWGVLWIGYFVLDGFDLGTGMLYPFLAKDEAARSAVRRSIGPVWDGNEVWLLTAGGATFAAFPAVYASMFSFLYTALLLVLFALIVRGVSLEFRAKAPGAKWARTWDAGIFVGSFLPALLFGVAFGNIFRGLPFDASGYHGSFFALLNPYSLVTGLLFTAMFIVHGALWVGMKLEGDTGETALRTAIQYWPVLLLDLVVFLALTPGSTELEKNYFSAPVLAIVPLLAAAALVMIRIFAAKKRARSAFFASALMIGLTVATGLIGLYPNVLPSRTDPGASLTIFNSSSTPLTLKIMTIVALIFVPIVIAYQVWVYRVFRKKISPDDPSYDAY
jgi:cytochrome d ubiquinol oxidase subunit II